MDTITSTVNLPRLDLFLDIETASKKTNAAILSIAAVPFDRKNGKVLTDKPFNVVIDLASCFFSGMSIDADTQRWWTEQSRDARLAILSADKKWIVEALEEFVRYVQEISDGKELFAWSQGSDFDFKILEDAITSLTGLEIPWAYNHKRDSRTWILENNVSYEDIPPVPEMKEVKHDAYYDAVRGAYSVIYTDNNRK